MRWLLLPLIVLLFSLLWLPAWAWDAKPKAIVLPPRPTAEQQALAAIGFLKEVDEKDAYYVRLLDWRGIDNPDELPEWKLLVQWWLNQMSMSQVPVYLKDVPGSPWLSYLDIREYRWVFEGWLAVAEREPYDWDGPITTRAASELRKLTGQTLRKELIDKDKYPILAMVSGDWLFRETIESNRSPSYYDLLFGKERYGKGGVARRRTESSSPGQARDSNQIVLVERGGVLREVPRSAVMQGEVIYIRGAGRNLIREGAAQQENYEAETKQGFVDFPRNAEDWERFFGLDIVRAFGKDREIDLDYGAVVEGGADNPKKGSIVALQNRLVLTEPSAYSIGMRTFDVFETEGERDFSEIAPKIPLLLRNKKLKFDGGELLAYLPNGGQAGLLINGETKRVEIAAGTLAQNTREKRMNPGVRNPGDCVTCHGDSGGYNLPTNLIKEYNEKGLDAKFKKRENYDRFKGFFLEWEENIIPYQTKYNTLLSKTTRTAENRKGWDGATLVVKFKKYRDQYDDPVDLKKALQYACVPAELFNRICDKSPRNALGKLKQGFQIPRSVWQKDAYQEWERQRVVGETKP